MPNTLSVTASIAGAAPENTAPPAPERYVSRAFFSQYNLILLAGSVAFALALASPVPLLLAAIGEVAWLGIGARSAAFRRGGCASANCTTRTGRVSTLRFR